MVQNLGKADRFARVASAIALFVASVVAPVPFAAQLGFALTGAYLLGSSLKGTCLGYRLMGVSTCPIQPRS
jgi:hypothetical protein